MKRNKRRTLEKIFEKFKNRLISSRMLELHFVLLVRWSLRSRALFEVPGSFLCCETVLYNIFSEIVVEKTRQITGKNYSLAWNILIPHRNLKHNLAAVIVCINYIYLL